MKTIKFILCLTWAFIVANCLSCTTPKAFPAGSPNPLDAPGHTPQTASALHAENIEIIRGIAR